MRIIKNRTILPWFRLLFLAITRIRSREMNSNELLEIIMLKKVRCNVDSNTGPREG